MNSTKAYEYETLQRAKDVVSKITKPSMSKSEKFETCFRWVMYQHYYDTRRIFYNQTAWPALYANDYLILSGKGGDCSQMPVRLPILQRLLDIRMFMSA